MLTVKLFRGKQFKQGHLSLGSWKWSLVKVMSCGKNALSVLREWKKPWAFMIFRYRVMFEWDACLCMGDLQAPPAPHFVFLITL